MTSAAPQLASNAPRSIKLRRVALWTLISAYSLSALISVIAILAGIEDIWKIVLTSTLIGNTALVGLCALTVSTVRKWAWLGAATLGAALLATLSSFILLWTDVANYTTYAADYSDSVTNEAQETFFYFLLDVTVLGWGYAWVLLFSCLLISTTHKLNSIAKNFAYITLGINTLFLFTGTILYYLVKDSDYGSSFETLTKFVIIISILGTLGTVITLTIATIQKMTSRPSTSTPTLVTHQPIGQQPVMDTAENTLNAFHSFAHQNNIPVDDVLARKLFETTEEYKRTR